jgi:hypothetical protein
MRTGEEFLLTFPVFVVLQAPKQPLGFLHDGGIHALGLFSDQAAAEEWQRPGDYLETFADLGKLLAYLYGVTDHTHVVLDPKKGKLGAFPKLADFIHWLERDNPQWAGPKFFHPFPELTPFECVELREKIRAMVQDQRMTIRQAAAALKIEERRALWLLENG